MKLAYSPVLDLCSSFTFFYVIPYLLHLQMDSLNNLIEVISINDTDEESGGKTEEESEDESEDFLAFVHQVQSGELARKNDVKIKSDFISSFQVKSPNEKTLPQMKNFHFTKRNMCFEMINKASNSTLSTIKPDISGKKFNFMNLLCPICYVFDCPMHKKHESFQTPEQTLSNEDESSLITEPCGKDCFVNIRNDNPQANSVKLDAGTQEMLELLIPTFKRAYCSIVPVLGRPECTCKDVYLFDVNLRKCKTESSLDAADSITVKIDQSSTVPKTRRKSYQRYMYSISSRRFGKESSRDFARYSCSHPGKNCNDDEANCPCYLLATPCEKSCFCPVDCRQRFIGCSCKGEGPSCCSSKACLCYDSGRECDPDVCTSCGADNAESKSCLNVAIQRELSKSLSVKPSSVHGWGAFAEETVEKGDFICEYIGELITKDVGEKRGIKYAELKSNYIFSLDNEHDIDATAIGNETRFINHATTQANCCSMIKFVNGENRVGIYASKRIEEHSELFMDYRYDDSDTEIYGFSKY
ncbi:Histone-lysine N-methyltransferase ezh1 [Tyrophagus putrescentiae]|nr:Histone-lysine N-methyltransferase ezh1 [Tyrophagus putrescentiae]